MTKTGLRAAVLLFITSVVLFSVVLISMNYIKIDEEFQVYGKVEEKDGGVEFVFYEVDNSFYGYVVNDVIEISPVGRDVIYKGIVLKKEIEKNVQLSKAPIYEYVVEIRDDKKIAEDKSGADYRIPIKQERTLMDLLLSEILRW